MQKIFIFCVMALIRVGKLGVGESLELFTSSAAQHYVERVLVNDSMILIMMPSQTSKSK